MSIRTPRPWLMLAVGVLAQAAASVVQATPAFLIPLLHGERGLSLAEAGLLAATPSVGVLLTLVLWGAATDRWGERVVLVSGLTLTAIGMLGAIFAQGYVLLGLAFLVAGMGSACASSASGRVVIGWFPAERRGFAMGIRQMSQPLGVAIAAVVVPALVASGSLTPALVFGAVSVAVTAVLCAAFIVNPARPPRATDAEGRPANPYRGDTTLARIHLVSALLVVPQYVLSVFGLVWLIADQGWNPAAAGVVVAGAQFIGAVGRIGAGILSDRVGSRLRPLRWVALAGIPLLLLTAGAGALHSVPLVAVSYVLASCISVADNGLAFTAVAEIAGAHWSGRALGAQNTGQFITAAAVAPLVGALIGVVGYSAAFALIALAPAIAVPLVPRDRSRVEPGAGDLARKG
jgi:MFS family permease